MQAREKQQLRLRVFAPGLDDALGALDSKAEWLYSLHGAVYLWHPASLFWLASIGLFAPETARADIVMPRSRCLPLIETRGAAAETCDVAAESTTERDTATLEGTHAALVAALPPSLGVKNASGGAVYFLEVRCRAM